MSLPPPLQDFIGQYIDSIETLEILLLLQRAPETAWQPAAVDSHLGMKDGTAGKRLTDLVRKGLVTKTSSGDFRYMPGDESRNVGVAGLAAAYAGRRVAVVNSIFSENLTRLRAFADAFKVKGE